MKIIDTKQKQAIRGNRRAFTLVEMLLVLTILAILAALVVPNLAHRSEQAKETAALSDIHALSTALDMFEVDNGFYPKGRNGLQSLLQKPSGAQNWRGPYLKDKTTIPVDPWGNAYVYECPGKHNVNGFDIMSMGPDGRVGGDDDICNWQTK